MKRRDDLKRGPREKAIEAIEAGKKREAIRYIGELVEEFRPLHDRYGDWILSLLGFINERLGEGAVEEALRRTFMDVYRKRAFSMAKMGHEEKIKRYCQSLRSHFAEFYLEEDDEKTTIVIPYCGSGGRLEKEGKARGRRTREAYPWSFNQKGVCYYCCHEAVFQSIYKEMGLEFIRYEYSSQFDDEGKATGDACRWMIYKKPHGSSGQPLMVPAKKNSA